MNGDMVVAFVAAADGQMPLDRLPRSDRPRRESLVQRLFP